MFTYSICALLLAIGAGCKGMQDSIAHHNSQKARGTWWDSKNSWLWKYKKTPATANTYALYDQQHERFWGSTRWFVAITDAWHFFGMLNMSCWQAAICLLLPFAWYWQLAAFVAIKAAYGGVFELVYRHFNKQAA